ncbi:MAG: hypothetical protein AAGI34_14930 [Pseudomonadota bacterium]
MFGIDGLSIVLPLALTTLGIAIALGLYSVRRMQRLKGETVPSALAEDGDPHTKQP